MTQSDEMTLSFGQYLQSCRKSRSLEIEAIARELRIGKSVLRAIENEDLSKMPDAVFAKGFLRGFAKMVGADEKKVVESYLQQLEQFCQSDPRALEAPVTRGKISTGRLILMAGAALVIICLMVYAFSGRENHSSPKSIPAKATAAPADATPLVPDESADVTDGEISAPPPESKPDKIRLSILTVAETWMKIIIDNGKANEVLLRPGDNLELEASSGYNLLIGNAAGVKLFANTVPVDVPGGKGKVVNIQVP